MRIIIALLFKQKYKYIQRFLTINNNKKFFKKSTENGYSALLKMN